MGSLGSILFLFVMTWAAGIASLPLNDNSFFTHLATGRLILDQGNVPSRDPYTFTAHGEPWTVQSWLASVVYAAAERLGGDVGLRVVVLALFLSSAALLWRLSRPATSILVRLALVALAMTVATGLWSERPYMIGVVGLSLVWLALAGELRPWLLVPVIWFWGNTHGSFVLALVLTSAALMGGAADRRHCGGPPLPDRDQDRRVFLAVAVGTVAVAVSPVGPRLLLFSGSALRRSDFFAEIVEWQAPSFRSPAELSFLALSVVTVLLVARGAAWRLALPAATFMGAAFYAQRNIVLAAVVLVAVASRCAPPLGSLRANDKPAVGRAVATVATLLAGLVTVATALRPAAPLDQYPGALYAWVRQQPWGSAPLGAEASIGNMVEVLEGPQGTVFVDDRFDMFPAAVLQDYLLLQQARPGWESVVGRHNIDVILWSREAALSSVLVSDPEWRVAISDADWIVLCRRALCRA